ncbi:MAG: chemotaxis protein CheX [Spirochaetes bacterium]|nr:chemotaxis protein CheX [Spirochaetota bacterium]
MDKDQIIPFVNASSEILTELLKEKPIPGQVNVVDRINKTQGLLIIIGITGGLSGRIIIDITFEQVYQLTNAILREEVAHDNLELIESAIGELGNMITGRAVSDLNEMGYNLNITPPTIVKGKEVEIMELKQKMLVVPLKTNIGDILLNLSVQKK